MHSVTAAPRFLSDGARVAIVDLDAEVAQHPGIQPSLERSQETGGAEEGGAGGECQVPSTVTLKLDSVSTNWTYLCARTACVWWPR